MTPPATFSTDAAPVNCEVPLVVAVGERVNVSDPVPVGLVDTVPFDIKELAGGLAWDGLALTALDGAALIALEDRNPLQSPPLHVVFAH